MKIFLYQNGSTWVRKTDYYEFKKLKKGSNLEVVKVDSLQLSLFDNTSIDDKKDLVEVQIYQLE